MVFDLLLGFLVLVAASYVGTTMALRGFFGRERYESPFESDSGGPPGSDRSSGPRKTEDRSSGPRETDDRSRDGTENE